MYTDARPKCLPGQILVTTLADMQQSTTGNVPASEAKLELAWVAHVGIKLAILEETFRLELSRVGVCRGVLRHCPATSVQRDPPSQISRGVPGVGHENGTNRYPVAIVFLIVGSSVRNDER